MPPSLRNGLEAFSSVPVGLLFSTLLDWFCDDFDEISGSVPLSLRCRLMTGVEPMLVGIIFFEAVHSSKGHSGTAK